jgi:hypothetical protein
MLRVNGLFGHIQRNNAKTLVLMVLFLLLVEGTQIALRMMPTAVITNINGQLPPWPEGPSLIEHHPNGTFSSKRSAKPEATATTPDRAALATAPAERNSAPVTKDAEGQSRSAPFLLEGPALAVISNPWLIALISGLIYILVTCYSSAKLISLRRAPGR